MAAAASSVFLASAILLAYFAGPAEAVEFMLPRFNNSNINTKGVAEILISPNGLLRLTDRSKNVIGHAFYPHPINMFQTATNMSRASSFSTYFVFAIVPAASSSGGFGMAFTISPLPEFRGAASGHFMGIFNQANDNNISNHVFAVEFDTVNGFNDTSDTDGNHVGINVNSVYSLATEPANYLKDGKVRKEDMKLESGKPIQAWIDYDGDARLINVTISPINVMKPSMPLMSFGYDLSAILKEQMYLGFSASTGDKASFHYVLGWSFSTGGAAAPALNISQLPAVPTERAPSSSLSKGTVKVLLGVALSGVIGLLVVFLFVMLHKKRKWRSHEVLEDWELNCAHRFTYKDLYTATKGFDKSEVIGEGGFGAVYKGVLPKSGVEVAVKKVAGNSVQGMQEFVAEVESLGRLRHKHLVNLQGWCKRKDDLLLIYDYIQNGSLDSFLYSPQKKKVLNWEQRFNILKGIASGLLYLHEEWEQVVIHRDVKSNNVLVDGDMNGRLGDFGLARLSDHGKNFNTTKVVGTIGYIAPEMARTGKASTSSDVFSYGVLLLEVACGRRPIDPDVQPEHLILMDWVIHCQQMGNILDASDPNLKSSVEVEEMVLVLKLGLLCSHQRPEARPTMRQVVRYLNGDDKMPEIDDWSSHSSNNFFSDKMTSRFLELISSDTSSSFGLSTVGGMSSVSIEIGK
ncbi:hypothetical protein QQ045_023628 [Rhodiola kirilowii]